MTPVFDVGFTNPSGVNEVIRVDGVDTFEEAKKAVLDSLGYLPKRIMVGFSPQLFPDLSIVA